MRHTMAIVSSLNRSVTYEKDIYEPKSTYFQNQRALIRYRNQRVFTGCCLKPAVTTSIKEYLLPASKSTYYQNQRVLAIRIKEYLLQYLWINKRHGIKKKQQYTTGHVVQSKRLEKSNVQARA